MQSLPSLVGDQLILPPDYQSDVTVTDNDFLSVPSSPSRRSSSTQPEPEEESFRRPWHQRRRIDSIDIAVTSYQHYIDAMNRDCFRVAHDPWIDDITELVLWETEVHEQEVFKVVKDLHPITLAELNKYYYSIRNSKF